MPSSPKFVAPLQPEMTSGMMSWRSVRNSRRHVVTSDCVSNANLFSCLPFEGCSRSARTLSVLPPVKDDGLRGGTLPNKVRVPCLPVRSASSFVAYGGVSNIHWARGTKGSTEDDAEEADFCWRTMARAISPRTTCIMKQRRGDCANAWVDSRERGRANRCIFSTTVECCP